MAVNQIGYPQQPVPTDNAGFGRALWGVGKLIPGVGNVLNGIDVLRDAPRFFSVMGNPQAGFDQKLLVGSDLLAHGIGVFNPKVGAMDDIARGVTGGLGFHGFGSALPALALGGMAMGGASSFGGANPMMPGVAGAQGPYTQQLQPPPKKTGILSAIGRIGIGWVKEHVPIVGNVLNMIDAGKDLTKGLFTWFNPNASGAEKLKVGTDLLAHTVGIFNSKEGGRYDVAQGEVRLAGGVAERLGLPISDNMVQGGAALFGTYKGFFGDQSHVGGPGFGGLMMGGLGLAGLAGAGGLLGGGLLGGGGPNSGEIATLVGNQPGMPSLLVN